MHLAASQMWRKRRFSPGIQIETGLYLFTSIYSPVIFVHFETGLKSLYGCTVLCRSRQISINRDCPGMSHEMDLAIDDIYCMYG